MHTFLDIMIQVASVHIVHIFKHIVRVTQAVTIMGSIPAIPYEQNVPLLLCHEKFYETSLPAKYALTTLLMGFDANGQESPQEIHICEYFN